MKPTIIGLLIAASGSLLLSSCSGEVKAKEESPEEVSLKPLVHIAPIELNEFIHEIRVQGNVETDQDVLLSAEMGGLITAINAKEGRTVRKGEVIARVDASVLSSNLEELRTQLEYAEYMLSKQEELKKRGVGSEFELETAKSQVNSLKASMQSLNTQRGKAVIKAPFTGVIDQVFARKGQMAGPSSPIVRLVNNSTIEIVSTISEKHFSKVKIGTPIRVSFPNYSDTSILLTIDNVGNYIEPTNRTFRIGATLKNNTTLLPNMLAEVNITDMYVKEGIVIPSKSVLKDQNNNNYVFIARKTKKDEYQVQKVIVEVIERYEGNALIAPSPEIVVGQQVVVDGSRGISHNDIVRTNTDTGKK